MKVSVSSGNCSFLLSRPAPRSPSVCGLGFSLPLARPISTEAWFRLSSVPERMRRRELGLGAAGSQYRHHIRGGDGSGHCICQRLYRQLAASASHSLSSAVISPGSATAHRCSGGPSPHAAGARAAALAADPTSGTGGAPALPSLSSVASSPPSAASPRSARPAPCLPPCKRRCRPGFRSGPRLLPLRPSPRAASQTAVAAVAAVQSLPTLFSGWDFCLECYCVSVFLPCAQRVSQGPLRSISVSGS